MSPAAAAFGASISELIFEDTYSITIRELASGGIAFSIDRLADVLIACDGSMQLRLWTAPHFANRAELHRFQRCIDRCFTIARKRKVIP